MDNIIVVIYVNKMGGIKLFILINIVKDLWEYCLERKIIFIVEYFFGFFNQIVDWESRNVLIMSINSWRLNFKIFVQINLLWGFLEMDLFVDRLNVQLEKYMSWKFDLFVMGIDVFLVYWGGIKVYVFLLFCLIQRCIVKVQKEWGELVIVILVW